VARDGAANAVVSRLGRFSKQRFPRRQCADGTRRGKLSFLRRKQGPNLRDRWLPRVATGTFAAQWPRREREPGDGGVRPPLSLRGTSPTQVVSPMFGLVASARMATISAAV
jgi:hypothetical protein